MKARSLAAAMFLVAVASYTAVAQLTGTKTIPGDYATLAAAIADLNTQGVGPGGVTFNVAAGYTETLSAPLVLTATGTAADPIIFQKSGVGANPLITAYVGTQTPGSAAHDDMWRLVGSDYVTIDGIDLYDPNTTNPATMEGGYVLYKASASDGAQNNTIKNCVITLNRVNNASGSGPSVEGSRGIEVTNATPTAATTALTPTDANGTNSNNRFYSNTIQNCNYGIVLSGYAAASPFTLGDTGNDIGGSSPATGNTILNFGGAPSATNPAAGIRANNQWSVNISYNTINNNDGSGVNHVSTLRGIFAQAGTSANATINNNTITIHGGGTTSQVSGIENGIGSTAAGNTVEIAYNDITGSYLTATSGNFYLLYNTASPATVFIHDNSVHDLNYSATALGGSGQVYGIYSSGAATTVNIRSNTVRDIYRTGTTGGTTIGIYTSSGTNQTVKLNSVYNFGQDGTGSGSTMYGIQTSTGTIVCDSNVVHDLTVVKTSGTGSLYGIYNIASPTNENYNYNQVYTLTHNGTGTVYGIYAFTTTGVRTTSNNLVYSVVGAGTTVAGINQASSSPTIFNNKIYDIRSTSTGAPTVSGLILGSLGTSGVANVYNNLIGDIKAPDASSSGPTSPTVRGINITTTTTSTTVSVSYNTVYLNASSTGANFSTAALYVTSSATATTAALTLRNNVFVNTSTPAGTGLTVAYQRSSTDLANYTSVSNNNDFYAGSPGPANLIFYDGTNADQTIAAFKARVSPREGASFTENPAFLSTSGSSPNFLHIDPSIPTQLESGGQPIAGITTDYDGQTRNASTPDVGADEFAGTPLDLNPPTISYTPLANTGSTANRTLTATITDGTGVQTGANGPRLYYKKGAAGTYQIDSSPSQSGNDFTFTINNALLGGVTGGDTIYYYVAAQDIVTPTPNGGTNPVGGSGVNPPGTTPPPSPNFYRILVRISTFPYTEDFEDVVSPHTGGLGWSTGIVSGTANDWVRATPAKTQISAAHGGTKAYVTLAAGNYSNSQNSFLQSPIFDFSSVVGNPTLSFWHNFKTETGWDACVLEYSTDGGTVWRRVDSTLGTGGTFNTTNSTGWYNSSSTSGPVTPPKWSGSSTAYTGHSSGWIQSTTTLVGFGGLSDVRFRWRFGSDGTVNDEGWAIDDVSVTAPLANDAGAQSVTRYPSAGVAVGQPVVFHALIKNFGTAAQASIPVSYSVNGGAPVGPVNATGLGPGDTVTVSFTGFPFVPSAPGIYVVKVFTQLPGDGNATNDTASTFFGAAVPISSYPYLENFTNPVNWVTGGDFNWSLSVVTGAGGATPDTAARANFFSETSGRFSFLASPLMNLPPLASPHAVGGLWLSFHVAYRSYISEDDSLKIYISTDGGMTITGPVFAKSFASTPSLATLAPSTSSFVPSAATHWRHETVDLSAYAGQNNVVLVFWGVSDFGNNCYIDNVRVYVSNDVTTAVVSSPGVVAGPQGISVNFISFSRPFENQEKKPQMPLVTLHRPDVAVNAPRLEAHGPAEKKGYIERKRDENSQMSPQAPGGTIYFAWFTGYPPSTATPEFATNTTATTPDGSIFTPNVVSDNKWWTITYSGDDYLGVATYDVSIDITGLHGVTNPDKLYILKRATSTASWVALSTTRSGNILTASGVQGFSDFGIGSDNVINPLPIVLGSFTARMNPNGPGVLLEWMTISEINNYGFYVQRRRENEPQWTELPGFVPGHGTTTEPQFYSYVDNTLTEIGLYHYRLRQVDLDGTSHLTPSISINVTSLTDVEEIAPRVFQLLPNYPNPFNPSTTIKFSVENTAHTTLELYNVLGQKVATLFNGVAEAGRYYRVKVDGSRLASGMYIYRLQSGTRSDVKKMLVMK